MKIINDLYDYEGLKILQDNAVFKFSLDSILLAEFVEPMDVNKKILDLCTGNAAIPLILSSYFKNDIVAFELQKYIFELAQESVILNHLEHQIHVIQDDVKNIKNYFSENYFDVIVANPPYFKYQDNSIINKNTNKAIARHEIFLNLEELFITVKYALKENGIFYFVHLPERLEEILFLCEKYHLVAKKIQFVYTKKESTASIVLFKCVFNAKNSLVVSSPLFIEQHKSFKTIFRR